MGDNFDQPRPSPENQHINISANQPDQEIQRPIPEPLNGKETAELVEQLYNAAGPRLGSWLVEANLVLTLAGARGHTEFYIDQPQPEDSVKIAELNRILESKGILFSYRPAKDGNTEATVDLDNLRGLERCTRMTRVPGLLPFDSTTGFAGMDRWFSDTDDLAREICQKDSTHYKRQQLIHYREGVRRGYPDIAVTDHTDAVTSGNMSDLIPCIPPEVSLYGGALPGFLYKREHSTNVAIEQTKQTWSTILRDFYDSDWHKTVSRTEPFIHARAARDDNLTPS